ncbi:WD repeat-containing protein 18 [Oopsacas minuta]|uniref:WD repeat-containing protein 18 n=1 Tax=Oopsacas minuta TaxID=111878 RepID=A0AAV7JRT6_9METZ|nr:WD repeat-containing protein 18 [Oopsacas minuta]
MISKLAVLISHNADTQSSCWTRLLVIDPLTGNTLDKREATGVDGRSVTIVGSPNSQIGDLHFIASSVTSRITRFLPSRVSGNVHSTQAPIRCLVSSLDGTYYLGAVGERVHVWESCTGNQVCVLSQHYQSVSALAFSPDGNYLISGGEDGIIFVWRFSLVISAAYMTQFSLVTVSQSVQHECNEARLKYTLSEHSLPITSLICGVGGMRGFLYSGSVDHSCKIWDLLRGVCIATIAVGGVASCLATDVTERLLLIGEKHGEIIKIKISFSLPHVVTSLDIGENNRDESSTATQHLTEVTSLVTLRDNIHFVSSDRSGQLITWHLDSLQPIRRLELHDAITSVLLLPVAISRAYYGYSSGGKYSNSLIKPPPPSWITGTANTHREGLTLFRQLRNIPIETGEGRVYTGNEGIGTEETKQTEEFINTRIANNEHFKKLTASLDDMYKKAIELDFNY